MSLSLTPLSSLSLSLTSFFFVFVSNILWIENNRHLHSLSAQSHQLIIVKWKTSFVPIKEGFVKENFIRSVVSLNPYVNARKLAKSFKPNFLTPNWSTSTARSCGNSSRCAPAQNWQVFFLQLGIHKEVIVLHLVLDCQKSFSNSFCLWLWACLGSSICLLGTSDLWKQHTTWLFTGKLSPCMDLSKLPRDRNQLCPSSYQIVDILGPMYSLPYFILWIKWIYDLWKWNLFKSTP